MMYFLQGFAIGFAYIAPIGMQNLFLINTALTQSKQRLVWVVLITFLLDFSLALSCFYGMGAIMETNRIIEAAVLCIGSVLILWIGQSLMRAKPEVAAGINANMTLKKVVMTAFVVTWMNPQALLDGTLLLGALRASLGPSVAHIFFAGVTAASLIWFTGLAVSVAMAKKRVNNKILRVLNVGCGAVIFGYGLHLLWMFITYDFGQFLA